MNDKWNDPGIAIFEFGGHWVKNYIILAFGFILTASLFCPQRLFADENKIVPAEGVTAAVTPEPFSPDHLKDKWGIGILFDSPLSFSDLRWWFDDKTAFDFYAGGSFSQQPSSDFNGNTIYLPQWSWGVGLGLRENIAHPIDDVWVQMAERLTYDGSSQQDGYSKERTIYSYNDLFGFFGVGFEAFVPFWRNLSLEGSVGLQGGCRWSQQTTISNGSGGPVTSYGKVYTDIIAQIANNVSNLFYASAHFYF